MMKHLVITTIMLTLTLGLSWTAFADEPSPQAPVIQLEAVDNSTDTTLTLAQKAAREIAAAPELVALQGQSVAVQSSADCGFIRHPDNSLTSLPNYEAFDEDGSPLDLNVDVGPDTPKAILVALEYRRQPQIE